MLRYIEDKHLRAWLAPYLRDLARRPFRSRPAGPLHLMLAVCDHFEPLRRDASFERGDELVAAWETRYPRWADEFRDTDGRPPRHTFFYPIERYEPAFLERLAKLAAGGFGEVEVHLHHDGDSRQDLERALRDGVSALADQGHLGRDGDGRPRYGFIHGNWALANSRADGRWCGVDDELPLLFETGCYADFTFPAPNECQPGIVNQIYWPVGDLDRRRAYDEGERARVGRTYDDRVLMITGPKALVPRRHRMPIRIETANLYGGDPPTASRLRVWLRQHIHVAGRPEWVFVKLHTHGAVPETADALLGDAGRAFHRALSRMEREGTWRVHYVTAREMYNVARAAMDGCDGDPSAFRDYAIGPPPAASG